MNLHKLVATTFALAVPVKSLRNAVPARSFSEGGSWSIENYEKEMLARIF
ncbi:MAG: hypothetical protein AAB866_00255 [Patescibacteria group bacterium]